ncbi:MAG: hypothetical protein JWP10_1426 [Nocardioidaceae bacterium]|nr:hypothetical protein [Nocardioidaceae bacterium]
MTAIVQHLRQASAALSAARESGMAGLDAAEIAEVCRLTASLVGASQSIQLDAQVAGERSGVARREGASSMQSFIAQTNGVSMRDASKDLALAKHLHKSAPLTREAMGNGLSKDKARVVARAMDDLPRCVTPDQRHEVETDLVDKARKHSVEDLRRAAKRALEVLDTHWADEVEGETLRAEEIAAYQAAEFTMSAPDEHGMVDGTFRLPTLNATMLQSALEAFTSPRHNSMVGIDETGVPYPKRLGRGFCDLIEHLPTDKFPQHGGVGVNIVIKIDADQLISEVGGATIVANGERVSAKEVRRLACGANLIPAVFGGESLPLELGRKRRLFDESTRGALALRDGGCAFLGCSAPPGCVRLIISVPGRSAA